MNKETIIGTGLSGLIGSRVVELLSPRFDFVDVSLASNVDILDLRQIEMVFDSHPGAVSVVHLAAFTDTNAAWTQNGDKGGLCYEINVLGTRNIADLCRRYNKYLIHISTDFVFDGTKTGPYLETDTPHPIDWYGETKLLAEKEVLNNNPDAAIIRIAYPYRARFDSKVDLVRKIKTKLEAGETVNMFSDQTTTPTFIDDVAAGLEKFLTSKPNGIYHLVGSSSQSPYEMAKIIAASFGLDQNLVKPSSLTDFLKTPNARPYSINGSLSNQKFVEEFGFRPKTLVEGIEEVKIQLNPTPLSSPFFPPLSPRS
jgi:dTDP-4-dehydrorhamnose reductase